MVKRISLDEATLSDITDELASRPLAFTIIGFEQGGDQQRFLNFNVTKSQCVQMLDSALEYMLYVTDVEEWGDA